MSIINSEPPSHYVERVRLRTVYPQARGFINVIFWLAVIAAVLLFAAGVITSAIGAMKTNSFWAVLPLLGSFVGFVMYIFVLIFLKSVAVAYFDAVDSLLESNRRKKDEG